MKEDHRNYEELAKDLYVKVMQVESLQMQLTEANDTIILLNKKLKVALEGLSHIDNPIARDTEKEINEISPQE